MKTNNMLVSKCTVSNIISITQCALFVWHVLFISVLYVDKNRYITTCIHQSTIDGVPSLHGFTVIAPQISNHFHCQIWDELTESFARFNSATVEVWEWIISSLYWPCDYLSMTFFVQSYLFYLQVRCYIVMWRTSLRRFAWYSETHQDEILNWYEVSKLKRHI